MKNQFYILSLAALLAACGSEEDPIMESQQDEAAERHPIVLVGWGSSRAESPLEDSVTSFGVQATKIDSKGQTQTVFPGYQVNWDATLDWHYDGVGSQYLRYWDSRATSYTFTAYAPYTDDASLSSDGTLTLTGISADNDWMVATTRRTIKSAIDIDVIDGTTIAKQSTYYEAVPLAFHHLMAEIEFKIYNEYADNVVITNFVASNIAKEIATTANYVAPVDGEYLYLENFDEKSYDNYTDILYVHADPLMVYGPDSDYAVTVGDPFLVLPQPFGTDNTIYITISYDVNGQSFSDGTIALTDGWQPGTHYTYYLGIRAYSY